jgi:hypothetical protein
MVPYLTFYRMVFLKIFMVFYFVVECFGERRNFVALSAKGLLGFLINYQKASCKKSAPNLNSDLFIIPFKPQEMCVYMCVCLFVCLFV